MKFQILIPTYNRREDLKKNLEYLRDQLINYNLSHLFWIAVSDNASNDGTAVMLEQFAQGCKDEIRISILKNETNVGLEQNTVNLLRFADADYIIWLGDDDFLVDGYLNFINETFVDAKLGWMIPGLIGVTQGGKKTDGRPANFDHKTFPPGYETLLALSHFGHQMSGLVVKRENLLKVYLEKPEWRNPYLFIFFLSYNQLLYSGVYAPSFKTTVNNYNQKDWSYNEIGLLDEVFKSYYYLKDDIGENKLNQLLLKFVVMHSYRINFTKGYGFVLKQWKSISESASGTKGFKTPLLKLLTKEYLTRKLRWK
jgi:glycosyltransferase involved in cell wall biosynthesis